MNIVAMDRETTRKARQSDHSDARHCGGNVREGSDA